MNKLKSRIGMTLAEILIVIGIIAVLGGVSFIAVYNYQRSLGQLERDGIAKEIFVAAQNHLTAAYGAGYLGTSYFGEHGTKPEDSGKEIYYYTVNGSISENSAMGQMLPFGSIDETVRTGGSYIVRYQKDTGTVLDVFYCSRNGSPDQYNHNLSDDEYGTVMDLRDTATANHKLDRRNWDSHILGWYGGTEVATLATLKLDPPAIEVVNGDTLYVVVTDPNSGKRTEGAMLQLVIEGMSSGAKKAISLSAAAGRVTYDPAKSKYTVMLDDITKSGFLFAELGADSGTFIPGENIKIQAVAYSTSALANISYSAINITNSLFGSISDTDSNNTIETANIYSIRHLENLDAVVSNLGSAESVPTGLEKIKIKAAVQTNDLNWPTFYNNSSTVIIYGYKSAGSEPLTTEQGYFYSIQPNYELTYDGGSHSISKIKANNENAGLFGSTSNVNAIKNLELIDFSITGSASAGALAGSLKDCTVTNVLAWNKAGTSTAKITATTDSGGLIGKLNGGTVQYSAAEMFVDGGTTGTAGGLIGSASGQIIGCYSGGHTKNGSYEEWVNNAHPYDVTGGTAGGLVGTSSATISNSYSTCSVSGTTAGGFAGTTSGSITNCYATGYIDPTDPTATTKYAFVTGSLPAGSSGNYYYKGINEILSTQPNHKEGETEPMPPYSGYEITSGLRNMKPIDLNAATYNEFVGEWDDWNFARAFDASLVKYYSGKYTLKTVDELIGTDSPAAGSGYSNWNQLFIITHYGDWPSPEVFFINT